jgi:hypothetical protein
LFLPCDATYVNNYTRLADLPVRRQC